MGLRRSAPRDRVGYECSNPVHTSGRPEAIVCCLDVISKVRKNTDLPLAAYNVSGEYVMIHALANSGGGDLHTLAMENLTAIQRAGADILLTYWANQYDTLFL